MVDVLGLHGIGQQQRGRKQMLPDWQASLDDGVERARGYGQHVTPVLDLAFYGDLFLAETDSKGGAPGTDDKGGPALETMDDDLLSFFAGVETEVVDSQAPLGEEVDKGLGPLPRPVSRLAAWLEREFGVAGRVLFLGDLVQVRRFQRDGDLAAAVLERVREVLQHRPRVLIGHSLGSIVAYEALCRIPDHGITTLLTVGSPLGLRSIREAMSDEAQDRSPELPPGVTRWVNVYDPRDAVSLAGGLSAYWPAVEDRTVDNGREPHAITFYLGKKVVGQVVVDALT